MICNGHGTAVDLLREPPTGRDSMALPQFLRELRDGRLLTADDLETAHGSAPRLVRNVLDAYSALDIELAPWLPGDILAWYRGVPQ